MEESERGRSAVEQDGSAQAPPRTSSSLSDDVESPTQVVPANVGESTISPEQFARFYKEMAMRFSEGSPNPSISFAPFTPGAKEQGGYKKPSPEGPVSDPEALKVYLRTLMASSGIEIDELREVAKEVSPATVAAPPVPQGAPKMPPAPQTQADPILEVLQLYCKGFFFAEEWRKLRIQVKECKGVLSPLLPGLV